MTEAIERAAVLRNSLKAKKHQRVASFSEAETFCLRSLLLDETRNGTSDGATDRNEASSQPLQDHNLSDDVLFSVPPASVLSGTKAELPAHHKPARRPSNLALWRAREKGVTYKAFIKQAVQESDPLEGTEIQTDLIDKSDNPDEADHPEESGIDDTASDVEVRPETKSDMSTASSWDEEDHQDNFDTWEVLRDEYAEDFGFDFSGRGFSLESIINDDCSVGNSFKILGTSADDKSVRPHVLTPPLMDALANFLPDEVAGENFWLRYSLVRDGASLDTMKSYVRGAHFTLIAIETPKGEVFGSFTSAPWRRNVGYFGGQPCFVWKMRHNRRSKCSSLFEQAQLESEIDVYMCTDKKELVQVCRHDQLAVGGDEYQQHDRLEADLNQNGFAFSLESDLLIGTTSPCKSFTSPALVGYGAKSQVFDVAGLEVWSFTSCFDVPSAQKLEMTKFFMEESFRSTRSDATASSGPRRTGFSSNDLLSERFYQRVGQDFESQERRNRWQYTNMMNPVGSSANGLQNSPRFM